MVRAGYAEPDSLINGGEGRNRCYLLVVYILSAFTRHCLTVKLRFINVYLTDNQRVIVSSRLFQFKLTDNHIKFLSGIFQLGGRAGNLGDL